MTTKESNGLTKARLITGIIGSVIGAITFFVTILFFFFNLKAGQENLRKDFDRHVIDSNEKINQKANERELDELAKDLEGHVKDEKTKLAKFVPKQEVLIEFKNINGALEDFKDSFKNFQNEMRDSFKSCQDEDKEFKQQIFNLMLEMKEKGL